MKNGSSTWQEIISQPQTWQSVLHSFEHKQAALEEFMNQLDVERFLIIGCGSTHYLSQTAAAVLTHSTGIPARALPSSELWLYPEEFEADKTMLLTISRSGTTTETSRAVEQYRAFMGGKMLAITCYPESQLAQQADFVLAAAAAQEESVAQTRSFTSMLLLTQALSASLSSDHAKMERLHKLPALLETLVDCAGDLPRQLGEDLSIERIYFLGGGPLYGMANEAMLKTKEMSLSISEAYHPLEFRHGPMSMVNEHTLVVGLLSDTGCKEEIHVLQDMQNLGARTLVLAESAAVFTDWRPDLLLELNSQMDAWERAQLYLPVIQQTAFHRALAKGLNPDQPHNLTAVIEL